MDIALKLLLKQLLLILKSNMQKMLLVFQIRTIMEHMKSTTLHMYTLLLKTDLVIQVLRQSY